MIYRDIKKLFYPKFLESCGFQIQTQERQALVNGKCIFKTVLKVERGKGDIEKIGCARAITETDITGLLDHFMQIEVGDSDKLFIITGISALYNPDGSLHHCLAELLEIEDENKS